MRHQHEAMDVNDKTTPARKRSTIRMIDAQCTSDSAPFKVSVTEEDMDEHTHPFVSIFCGHCWLHTGARNVE